MELQGENIILLTGQEILYALEGQHEVQEPGFDQFVLSLFMRLRSTVQNDRTIVGANIETSMLETIVPTPYSFQTAGCLSRAIDHGKFLRGIHESEKRHRQNTQPVQIVESAEERRRRLKESFTLIKNEDFPKNDR